GVTGGKPHREGNKVGRQGGPGIGALHSTAEAGELVPRGPGGGKGAPRRGAVAGQQRGGIEPRLAVHETATGSAAHVSPRRDEPDALIGHVRICGRRRGLPRRRPGPQHSTLRRKLTSVGRTEARILPRPRVVTVLACEDLQSRYVNAILIKELIEVLVERMAGRIRERESCSEHATTEMHTQDHAVSRSCPALSASGSVFETTLPRAVSRGRRFRPPDRRKGRSSAQPCSGRRS